MRRGLGDRGPPGSAAGPREWAGRGSASRRGPPAKIAFPGCVSLAFPDAGAAAARARGAAMAGGEAGRPASAAGPSLLLPAFGRRRRRRRQRRLQRRPVMAQGAGRSRQLPGSASRGPSRAPPPVRPVLAGKLRLGRGKQGWRRGGVDSPANSRAQGTREAVLCPGLELWVKVQFLKPAPASGRIRHGKGQVSLHVPERPFPGGRGWREGPTLPRGHMVLSPIPDVWHSTPDGL